jgi:MFS family permease
MTARRTTTTTGWAGVVALGVLTITSYGSWFYAFGVLIDPITTDTGWTTTALGITFGAAQVLTGFGAFLGGRLLDRFDAPGPFLTQAVVGGGLLFVASAMQQVWLFAIAYALGAGVIGGTGFYNVTTAAAARLRPDQPEQAIARLTIIGAFCSPIYLPFTAWLVTTTDWRTSMRILAALAVCGALLAATFARGARSAGDGPSADPIAAMRAAVGRPEVRRMLAVYLLAGIAFASVLVYQVPVMTAAGLSLGTAGAIGGLRGFCQVFGRVGLTGLIDRFGVRALLRTAYAITAIGILLLPIGSVGTGVAYAVLAGVGLGATSPLQAMYAREHFDEADLGLLMGLQGAALGVAGGIGPLLGGIFFDTTGSWLPIVIISGIAATGAATLLRS